MALIIEELNRGHRVQARYRMDGERITLGRGYQNDVILEDAHVDAAHAEIVRDVDGCYRLRDLDSVNGIRLLGNCRDKSVKPETLHERLIQSGDEFEIGQSRLRVSNSESELAPAIPLHSLENFFARLSHPSLAVALTLAVAGLTLLTGYLALARKFEWMLGINLVTGAIGGLLIYAGAWAFIGRVVRHEPRFFTHLSIAALGALIYSAWERFGNLLNFNYSLAKAMPLLDIAVLALLIPALLWAAAFLALNISSRWRWALAVVLPWTFLGLSAIEQVSEMREFSEVPEYSTELHYRDLLWRNPVAMQQFIGESKSLFDIPLEAEDSEEKPQKAAPNASEGDSADQQEAAQ